MNNMTFGECLKCMLSALDVSMNRLAKSINVDNSLVNRWVHGERIPPYGSSYIENIAGYLSKNVHYAYQIKNLNELFIRQGLYPSNTSNIEDRIKRVLSEAQGYSYECKKRILKDKRIKIKGKTAEEKNYKAKFEGSIKTNTEPHIFQMKTTDDIFALSSNDKVILGSDNINMLVLDLLDEAVRADWHKNKIIYMTYNNNVVRTDDEIANIRNRFIRAIKNGWKIIILIKLDNDLCRILNFIKFAMPLIISGGLIIYYYNRYGLFDVEREAFVIPEIGAVSSFVYNNCNSELNTAFYLKSGSAVNVFKEYFEAMLKNDAHPLIRNFAVNEYTEYCRILTEADEAVGSRMSYKSNLNTLMLPEQIYIKLLKKYKLSDDVIGFAFKNYKKQCNSFKRNIRHYEYNEIYLMDSINSLIEGQEFYLYYYSGIQQIKLDIEDIIELLKNIIHNLETYKHYNISFINERAESLTAIKNFSFVLKERKALFYENYRLKDNYPEVSVFVDEPLFVKAFEEYFRRTWEENIAPVHKEKLEVIKLLQRHMDALEY